MDKTIGPLGASNFDVLENASFSQPKTNSSILTSYGCGRGKKLGFSNESRSWNTLDLSTVGNGTRISGRLDSVSPWVMEVRDNAPQRRGKGRGQKIYESCLTKNPQFDASNAARISRQIEQVVGNSHRNYTLKTEYQQYWSPTKLVHNVSNESVETASPDESFSSAVEDLMENVVAFDKEFPVLQCEDN